MTNLTSPTNPESFADALRGAVEAMGVDVSREALAGMAAHYGLMLRVNEEYNLTTIIDPLEAAVKHYADSLAVLRVLDGMQVAGRAIDIGSGAGFPGVPLALARPQWKWVLVEARQKKAAFLNLAVEELRLENVAVVADRSEAMAHQPEWRDRFSLATGRAVAALGAIVELLAPFVASGGRIVAMKGPKEPVVSPHEAVLAKLGCGMPRSLEYELPEGMGRRSLIVLEKVAPTPSSLPRRPGMAAKRPLF